MALSPLPIKLSLPPVIYVSGSVVDGHVLLDFRQLQAENIQEIYIKFRGFLKTTVKRNKRTHRENIPLIYTNLPLWKHGDAYPPPGSDVLTLPFRFQLPEALPPSFFYDGWQNSASVAYSVTAVGVRPGVFHSNRRIPRPIVVVPRDDAPPPLQGPQGMWEYREQTSSIRKGIWGAYSTVHVRLSMPNTTILPLFVDIPYMIQITTTTAPLLRTKADEHPADKPIFPAPPVHHSAVSFRLLRVAEFMAELHSASAENDAALFLGEGTNANSLAVDTELPEKEWVPVSDGQTEGEEGTWVQRATFRSHMRLAVPPTFRNELLQVGYALRLKVPFPGIGNDVVLEWPVRVVSGVTTPVPLGQPPAGDALSVPSTSDSSQVQGGGMYTLDLPPSYWNAGGGHWGDHDEQD